MLHGTPLFDPATLTLVTAVFHAFMAIVWLSLAGLFRIAPTAGLLLAGAYVLALPALYCPGCSAGWPASLGAWMPELPGIASLTLLALGVRRLMRLRKRRLDLLLIGTVALLSAAYLNGQGAGSAALIAASIGMGLLAIAAARDVLVGTRAEQPAWLTAWLAAPYFLLALLVLARAATLAWLPAQRAMFVQGLSPSALQAWAWLVLTLGIALGLVGLVVGRLVARIQHMTWRDPLTDTLNRRALKQQLQALQAQAERGHTHCVLMLDVDHFKRINDSLGHAGGDAALLHLVQILRANMRALDQLGRLGGEEFCVLLPHTALADAGQVAQRMCDALRAQALAWPRHAPVTMTASFGVVPCQLGDPQGDATLAMADWLVYRAKNEGRDRICVANGSIELIPVRPFSAAAKS